MSHYAQQIQMTLVYPHAATSLPRSGSPPGKCYTRSLDSTVMSTWSAKGIPEKSGEISVDEETQHAESMEDNYHSEVQSEGGSREALLDQRGVYAQPSWDGRRPPSKPPSHTREVRPAARTKDGNSLLGVKPTRGMDPSPRTAHPSRPAFEAEPSIPSRNGKPAVSFLNRRKPVVGSVEPSQSFDMRGHRGTSFHSDNVWERRPPLEKHLSGSSERFRNGYWDRPLEPGPLDKRFPQFPTIPDSPRDKQQSSELSQSDSLSNSLSWSSNELSRSSSVLPPTPAVCVHSSIATPDPLDPPRSGASCDPTRDAVNAKGETPHGYSFDRAVLDTRQTQLCSEVATRHRSQSATESACLTVSGSLTIPSLSQLCQELVYDEIAAATNNFHPSRKLGKGASGSVYWGTLRNGTDIAVKALQVAEDNGFEEEVRVLSRCRHPNLVTLLGWATKGEQCFVIYELLLGGDVCQKLQDDENPTGPRFHWRDRLRVALQTTQAVAYLHSCRPKVFHRDVKTANVLLDEHGTAKLADFGLACFADFLTKDSRYVAKAEGTPGYADPRYVSTLKITEPREMYSLGMMYLELLTSRPPAVYVTLPDGTRELKYLLEDLGSLDVRAVLEAVDRRLNIPQPLAMAWASLALRCIADDESARATSAEAASTLRQLWNLAARQQPYRSRAQSDVRAYNVRLGLEASARNAPLKHEYRTSGLNRSSRPDSCSGKDLTPGRSFIHGEVAKSPSRRSTIFDGVRSKVQHAREALHVAIRHQTCVVEDGVSPRRSFPRRVSWVRRPSVKGTAASLPRQSRSQDWQRESLPVGGWTAGGSPTVATSKTSRMRPLFFPPPRGTGALFSFRLVGDVLQEKGRWSSVGPSVSGAQWHELRQSIVAGHHRIAEEIGNWIERNSSTKRERRKSRLFLHDSAKDGNSSSTLSILLHETIFGRKRQGFSTDLKRLLPNEWFTCISRQHFSISLILTLCPNDETASDGSPNEKGRFVRLHEGSRTPKSPSDSMLSSYQQQTFNVDLHFQMKCLSTNGSGLNEIPLASGQSHLLSPSDLIHVFSPSCEMIDQQQQQHEPPRSIDGSPARRRGGDQFLLGGRGGQKISALTRRELSEPIDCMVGLLFNLSNNTITLLKRDIMTFVMDIMSNQKTMTM